MPVQIAVTPTFLQAHNSLPQHIQQKNFNLLSKFRDNPKSSAINYEKINGLKDKQFRSLRVDQTYRAIVHEPENGDGTYHFLWVDHHDEAYAWAKDKVFRWNQCIDAFQLIYVDENIEHEPVSIGNQLSGPLSKIRTSELLRMGIPDIFVDKVQQIQSLAELEKWKVYLPMDAYEQLYYLLDNTPLDDLIKEVAEGKASSNLDTEQSVNNRRFCRIISSDSELEEILKGDTQVWRVFLHPSQRKLAEGKFDGPVRVSGGAGTGKSVVALHRAKYICDKWIGKNDKPLLFTTFTRSLTAYLKEQLESMELDSKKYKVNNLHNLAVCHAKQLGLIPDDFTMIDYEEPRFRNSIWEEVLSQYKGEYDIPFFVEEYTEMVLRRGIKKLSEYNGAHREEWQLPFIKNCQPTVEISKTARKQIWQIMRDYEAKKRELNCYEQDEVVNLLAEYYQQQKEKPFSHIICDELQDFSLADFRLLRAMVAQKANDLFLVGDPLQKIYDKPGSLTKAGIHIAPGYRHHLKLNYRTTEEIRSKAIQVIAGADFESFEGGKNDQQEYTSLLSGEVPMYECFQDQKQEVQKVIDIIRPYCLSGSNTSISLSDICICTRKGPNLNVFEAELSRLSIPYCKIKGYQLEGDRQGVRLSTMHSIKGLEFRVVILVDVSEETTPYKFRSFDKLSPAKQQMHLNFEKALHYVAITRAVERLYITGTGTPCSLLNSESEETLSTNINYA